MPIELLRRLKGSWSKTGAQAPPPPQNRTYDEPPKPSGDWVMIVDKFGDPVIGREPNGGDFLARYPIKYDYRGTIPPYNPDQYETREERIAAAMDYAERNHRNKNLLDKAVFILSQTDDGRRLLQMAEREGYHFVFDQARLEKEGALGLHDATNKQIPLAEGQTAEDVALIVKHELQHMDDNKSGASYSINHTLTSGLICDRAIEANARVSEAIAAVESLNGSPHGPERQFRTSALFASLYESWPNMAQIAHENLGHAQKGAWNDFARPVFDGYFQEHGTLNYYDKRQVEKRFDNDEDRGIKQPIPPNLSSPVSAAECDRADHSARQFAEEQKKYWEAKLSGIAENDRWTYDQDTLKAAITVKGGTSYLTSDGTLDLTSPQYIGFGTEAKEMLAAALKNARVHIPERVEEIETGLIAPDRKVTAQKPIISPYLSEAKEDDFEIIRHPNRHDHEGYEVAVGSPGRSSRSRTTELFEKSYARYSENHSELDATSLAIQYMYDNQNTRAAVKDIVDCGFVAPVAAFPDEFIMDLCQNIKYMQETGEIPNFTDHQFTLLNHWRELAERGHDPVYGSDELKEGCFLFEQMAETYFNSYLKPYFDQLDAAQGHKRGSAAQPRTRN